MAWTSIIAIYLLIWVITAFALLPFGVQTHEEAGIEKVPGQADSAPAQFRPGRVAIRATVIALIVTGLFVLNYEMGWISVEDINVMAWLFQAD